MNLKISATRCGLMAAALVGSAVLVVGLSANAEATTGTLSWQGPNGQGWTLTNPPNGVCRTFNNTAAYGPNNNTDKQVILYSDFNCNNPVQQLCAHCSLSVSTTKYYSFKY